MFGGDIGGVGGQCLAKLGVIVALVAGFNRHKRAIASSFRIRAASVECSPD